jgi:hypothetical protein
VDTDHDDTWEEGEEGAVDAGQDELTEAVPTTTTPTTTTATTLLLPLRLLLPLIGGDIWVLFRNGCTSFVKSKYRTLQRPPQK